MAKKTLNELIARQEEINNKLGGFIGRELNDAEKRENEQLLAEFEANKREITTQNQAREAAKNAPVKSVNEQLREIVAAVREGRMDGTILMKRDATSAITSGVIQVSEKTNMESAGIPISIQELIEPLEYGLIYNQLGIKVATGVRGKLQWPVLDSVIEATVGGELDEVDTKVIDFSKITTTPYKLGLSIEVSNEAINDAAFDLRGVIVDQMGRAMARTLNKRALALSAPGTAASFVGPLVSHRQTKAFAGSVPTYAELKELKGKVLGTGAQMAGFCYVMDAAMYSNLEAKSRDAGSGRFVIEGGKIDGDPVFITNLSAYEGRVIAGCFGYEALNQHGDMFFIVDPYSKAKKNVTVFTVNADFSLTYLVRANDSAPFAIGYVPGESL